MNVRRGFFRLWVLFTAFWCLLVIAFNFDNIRKPPIDFHDYLYVTPVSRFVDLPHPWSYYQLADTHSAIEIEPRIRVLVAPGTPTDKMSAISAQAKELFGLGREAEQWASRRFWTAITAAVALGVPAAIFIVGWALIWAFSGFRSTKRPASD